MKSEKVFLRECNAGIKMGASAIAKVMPHVKNPELKSALGTCRETHNELGSRAHKLLKKAHEDTKSTHPIAEESRTHKSCGDKF